MKPRLLWLCNGYLTRPVRLRPRRSFTSSCKTCLLGSLRSKTAASALEPKPRQPSRHEAKASLEAASSSDKLLNPEQTSRLVYSDDAKRELLDLVPKYTGASKDEALGKPGKHSLLTQRNSSPSEARDVGTADMSARRKKAFQELTSQERKQLRCFDNQLFDSGLAPEEIVKAFMQLPPTRYILVRRKLLRRLFKALSIIPHITPKQAFTYLKVAVEAQKQGVRLNKYEWNSFVHLSGLVCGPHGGSKSVEVALQAWAKMEDVGKVPSNIVSFTILLNSAVRGKQYRLAEEVFVEMLERGIRPNRYMFINQIELYGHAGNGAGIRRVYKSLIDCGEIIDTTVLNTLITALCRTGEADAAEKVFENMQKMKQSYGLDIKWLGPALDPHITPAERHWMLQRQAGKILQHANVNRPKSMSQRVHDTWSLGPNGQTFHILIAHYARAGDYVKVCKLKHKMARHDPQARLLVKTYGVIFEGFAIHGGHGSDWTAEELESVWTELSRQVAKYEDRPDEKMKQDVVEAFNTCIGPQRAAVVQSDLENLEASYIHGHAIV